MKKINLLFSVTALIMVLGFLSCKNDKSKVSEETTDSELFKEGENQSASFDYSPALPQNGKLKGVVELGASGFNLFIIDVDKNMNWSVKKKEFGNSLISESMTSSNEVKSTLKDYIRTIIDFGVNSKDIHFVVSSGAAKEKITETVSKALKEIGYVVNVVKPEEEATYAFKCVLPKEYGDKAFVVDMGSGNTKISFMKEGAIIGKESYGAKYFQKGVDAAAVFDDVVEKCKEIQSPINETCFILGGVPFELAKFSKKGDERYTILDANVATYDGLAKEKGEKIMAGLNIYKGVLDATKCKKIVFDWDSNFTIGFLLGLPY